MRFIECDYSRLPPPPFNIYLVDHEGSVNPKRIFTVTRKKTDPDRKCVQLLILELCEYVDYDRNWVHVVAEFYVN